MGVTRWSGAPFPSLTDVDDPAGDIRRLAEYLDSRVILKAASAADRDSKYQTLPTGSLVAARGAIWQKMTDSINDWRTVWQFEAHIPWVNLTYPPGHANWDATRMAAKRVGDTTWLRGTMQRMDGNPIPPEAGKPLTTLPLEYRPKLNQRFAVAHSLTGTDVNGSSSIHIQASTGFVTWHYQAGPVWWLQIDCTYRND